MTDVERAYAQSNILFTHKALVLCVNRSNRLFPNIKMQREVLRGALIKILTGIYRGFDQDTGGYPRMT